MKISVSRAMLVLVVVLLLISPCLAAYPIVIGKHPKAPANIYGDPNPNATYFEKRLSPQGVTMQVPSSVPIQYIEMYQDRPVYTLDQNPGGIIGNGNIIPPGCISPSVYTTVVSPLPVMDYIQAMNWYKWSEDTKVLQVTGNSSLTVMFYVSATPAEGDTIKAILFDPGDGTTSAIGNTGGTINGNYDQSTKIVNGCPVNITWDNTTTKAYISHTYRFNNQSSYKQMGAEETIAQYNPKFSITTTNGCRVVSVCTPVKVWKMPVETGTATIYIDSNVTGMNVWMYNNGNAPWKWPDVGDPLLGGYLGKTPLTITVPVTGEQPFKVWMRDTHYYDSIAPVVVLRPGEKYHINQQMIEKTRDDYLSGCWLAGGFVNAYDSETHMVIPCIISERIDGYGCPFDDWYTPKPDKGNFYAEYYPDKPDNYTVQLRVSSPGYEDVYTDTKLEALTRQIISVCMNKTSDVAILVTDLTNTERVKAGLPRLTTDVNLIKMAVYHSNDQVENNYLGHGSPSGETITDRMRLYGVAGTVLENVCRLTGTDTDVKLAEKSMSLFMGSESHRSAILNTSISKIGVGVASNGTTTVITQEFK